MALSGTQVQCGTVGAAVNLVDVGGRTYYDVTIPDLHETARNADLCHNLHFVQYSMVARDKVDHREINIEMMHACCAGTRKNIEVSFSK